MTDYDPPGITNPENVDALTHQQIKDAFDVIENATHDMVTNWGQARAMWRDSTTALVHAVRSAVDGKWTGAAADNAATAVNQYGSEAEELVALFEQTASVVVNTATTAVMTKSFLPPVVQVTADQKTDPVEYDRQTRQADTAQAEARRIMQERYVVGFMHQDTKLPTYPPAVSPINDGPAPVPVTGPTTSAAPAGPNETNQDSATVATQPSAAAVPSADVPVQNSPDHTQAAATDGQPPTATTQPASDSSRSVSPRTPSNVPAAPAQTPSPAITPGITPGVTPLGGPAYPGGRPNLGSGVGSNSRVPSSTGTPAGPGVSRPAVPSAPPGLAPAAAGSGTPASGASTRSGGAPGMTAPGAGRGKDEEREKKDKKIDLTHESNTVELLGKNKYVPPTLGS
ncbi:hypothetical protein ACIA8C_27055 [Nocardia sp. NPDC051321]|uniref:hypothetical protein n=1 Tax=Nocardia sp. NPDC051321 TaxID=3364323 RepID=UPI00379D9794